MFACLFQPAPDTPLRLVDIAADFSPRYERHGDDVVSMDISGLGRLFGSARDIGEELRRDATRRGLRVHIAVAATRTAAIVVAMVRPGLTVVAPGEEGHALASIPIGVLEKIGACGVASASFEFPDLSVFRAWGLTTLGDLAALPSADLAARVGSRGVVWQAIARGQDERPLVPTLPDERFEASLDLEWPVDGLEPLSFVLTRLLEPLSIRLERRDRGAAVLHVELRLASKEMYARSLQLPSPMRDVRTLRTLALLDLESHPPPGPVDRVAIRIEPTPGRVLQHRLFTRAQPTPEQLSTLIARLGALMGQDRIGAPAAVDSYRPGAFEMREFVGACGHAPRASAELDRREGSASGGARLRQGYGGSAEARDEPASEGWRAPRESEQSGAGKAGPKDIPPIQRLPPVQPSIVSALRRCREPVPARVAISDGRPVRVTTDRRGFAGGGVLQAAGPWRTSGRWWSACGHAPRASAERDAREASASGGGAPRESKKSWNRDEWDVALSDGAVYRIFQDRETEAWFIDAIVD
jgi:nucleotidyltransferase/DNA polymerase involved in DNA repair